MSAETVGSLLEMAIITTFYMAAPMLFGGLIVGVFVSIVQAVTQLNEVTLVFIPKMLAVGLALWLTGPWMYEKLFLLFQDVLKAVSTSGQGF
jgi:flagellar biosynthetic protein FliQ